jgi:hypothetical protein
MTECVEAASFDPEFFEQGIKVALPQSVHVPRGSVAGRKQKTEFVRFPPKDVLAKVFDQERRDFADPVPDVLNCGMQVLGRLFPRKSATTNE